jgi:hydrogenase nickel incorporation protein HypA/HybF
MHEFGLLTNLLRSIEKFAASYPGRKVVKVYVRLGALSHISAEHFREHFREAAVGTIAENAALDLIESSDQSAPEAQDILLERIELEE